MNENFSTSLVAPKQSPVIPILSSLEGKRNVSCELDGYCRESTCLVVPFNFYWNDGGEQVSVAGSFNNWTPVPMNETADNSFELTLDVPRGEIEFKFIVDGVWKESNEYDTKLSSMNSLNNVKLIDIMERANHPEQPQHLEDNSPAADTQNTTNNININTERVQEDTSNSQQHKDLVTDTNIQNQSTMKRTVPDRKEHSTKSCRGMCCVS